MLKKYIRNYCYDINFMYYFLIDGWTTDDLQYLWKRKDPVQIVENLHLPRFTLEKYISDYCNIKTNTGKTDILQRAL